MRLIGLIFLFSMWSCGERITQDNYAELKNLYETLEKTGSQLSDDIQNNLNRIENTLKERGQYNQSESFASANSLVSQSLEYQELIREWKEELIIKSGGFSDEYSEPIYWYRNIKPENHKPISIHPNWTNVYLIGSKPLIIALIELSNHEIQFLTNQLAAIEAMSSELNPKLSSEIFLVSEIKIAYQEPRTESIIWQVNCLPIDTLEINGISYTSDTSFRFSKEEWSQMIDPNTIISVDFKQFYADTTLHFRAPR